MASRRGFLRFLPALPFVGPAAAKVQSWKLLPIVRWNRADIKWTPMGKNITTNSARTITFPRLGNVTSASLTGK